MLFSKSFYLTRISGIDIKLDLTWFLVFFLFTFTLAFEYFQPVYHLNTVLAIVVGAFSSILLFISVFLHELSHSLVAKYFNIPVKEINLFIFGGVAVIEDEAPSPKVELLIAIAGPIMSLLLGVIFLSLANLYPESSLGYGILIYLSIINFGILIFNLIPAFPLDGGRVLRAVIWQKKGLLEATRISSLTGKVFSFTLIAVGLLFLVMGNIITAFWYAFLGFYLLIISKISYEQTKLSVILSRYKVENLMDVIRPLFPNQTVAEYMNTFYPIYKTHIYPVIGEDGKFYYISIDEIKRIPFTEWEFIPVKEIQKPLNVYVTPYDTLTKALKLMNKYNLDELPVILNNTLLGLVKREKIEFLIQSEYGKL